MHIHKKFGRLGSSQNPYRLMEPRMRNTTMGPCSVTEKVQGGRYKDRKKEIDPLKPKSEHDVPLLKTFQGLPIT